MRSRRGIKKGGENHVKSVYCAYKNSLGSNSSLFRICLLG